MAGEEEGLHRAPVPSSVGGKHISVFPEIYRLLEDGHGLGGPIIQGFGLYEDGVREHVHLVAEAEKAGLGIVGAVDAFYHLPVLVAHGSAILEVGHRIAGIVVQIAGAEGILVLVHKLHHAPAELHQGLVDEVLQVVAGEDGFILNHLHVALGDDLAFLDIPLGRIAYKIGPVMKEGGVHGLAVVACSLLYELDGLGLDEAHE